MGRIVLAVAKSRHTENTVAIGASGVSTQGECKQLQHLLLLVDLRPSSELWNPAEVRTVAASMYQPREDKRGEFFTDTPQKIFAHLLNYKPSPQQLVEWMSNEKEIDRRFKGTELANFATKDAPQQRNGVLASLGLVADSLRLLPTRAEAHERE